MSAVDLDNIVLRRGAHPSPGDGTCVTEAVAFVAGEPHSDHPACLSPVLGAFLRSRNDGLPSDEERDRRLKRFVPRVIGTAGDGHDEERAWMATDWLVRVHTPAFLDAAGLTAHASSLRGLPESTADAAATWRPPLEAARQDAAAARTAAGTAAGDAVWAAARDAARDAAWDAAWTAVRGTEASYEDRYAAAKKAVTEALARTVADLQDSADDLLERMVALGEADRKAVA